MCLPLKTVLPLSLYSCLHGLLVLPLHNITFSLFPMPSFSCSTIFSLALSLSFSLSHSFAICLSHSLYPILSLSYSLSFVSLVSPLWADLRGVRKPGSLLLQSCYFFYWPSVPVLCFVPPHETDPGTVHHPDYHSECHAWTPWQDRMKGSNEKSRTSDEHLLYAKKTLCCIYTQYVTKTKLFGLINMLWPSVTLKTETNTGTSFMRTDCATVTHLYKLRPNTEQRHAMRTVRNIVKEHRWALVHHIEESMRPPHGIMGRLCRHVTIFYCSLPESVHQHKADITI